MTFIESFIAGHSDLDDIDDYVDDWHTKTNGDEPLHEYLGMTHYEYGIWVVNPDALPFIIDAHRSEID